MSKCENYCGVACFMGSCPNALNEMDMMSDTDEYSDFHLEKKINCKDCYLNKGCDDCYFYEKCHFSNYKSFFEERFGTVK